MTPIRTKTIKKRLFLLFSLLLVSSRITVQATTMEHETKDQKSSISFTTNGKFRDHKEDLDENNMGIVDTSVPNEEKHIKFKNSNFFVQNGSLRKEKLEQKSDDEVYLTSASVFLVRKLANNESEPTKSMDTLERFYKFRKKPETLMLEEIEDLCQYVAQEKIELKKTLSSSGSTQETDNKKAQLLMQKRYKGLDSLYDKICQMRIQRSLQQKEESEESGEESDYEEEEDETNQYAPQNPFKIDKSYQRISPDYISEVINLDVPPSITSVFKEFKQKNKITHLNLSHNNITMDGAITLFNRCEKELTSLKELNLSYNRVYELEFFLDKFNRALVALLEKSSIEKVDISNNGIANRTWYSHFFSNYGDKNNIREKLYWG